MKHYNYIVENEQEWELFKKKIKSKGLKNVNKGITRLISDFVKRR
jgi:hypothetical protein